MNTPDPIFMPGEPARIAFATQPDLVGLQVEVLDISYRTWSCGDDFFWTGWGCRLSVESCGTTWWSEKCLKKLPGNTAGQWLKEFIPTELGEPTEIR